MMSRPQQATRLPFVAEIVDALEAAYTADLDALAVGAIAKAGEYDADVVFARFWQPLLAQMTTDPVPPVLDRDEPFEVAVIVPMVRPENADRLIDSFEATNDGRASLYLVRDEGYDGRVNSPRDSKALWTFCTGKDQTTYAEKVNLGFSEHRLKDTPWVFLCGDDVEFHPGWLEEASKLADRYDVIGTNDSLPGRVRNPDVALGNHADHFFVRRAYVDTYGACLDGPGSLAPTAYSHWFVDQEMIGLAKARNTFTPCLTSIVEHHHPGYDGRDDLRFADPTYTRAVEHSVADQKMYDTRKHLIEMQRTSRGRR